MSRKATFLDKYNIFKHWPPFVRAYRQNASGMEATPGQKRYLQWGTIILVALVTIGWFIYYLPYFRHQADISLFTYTGDFVRPFFDGSSSFRISEFLWRFVAQFYLNVPLMVLVVAFMVIGFCITSWKTAGPYTPFLLPLFFLLFTSPNPTQASIAISLWLNMGVLSFYFGFFRHAARHPRSWAPLIVLHLYAAILSVALYYATGHWALVFSIAVVLVHLIGVPMALSDKEQGLWKIRLWNFIVASLISVAAGLVFWKASSYPGFSAPWYVWLALILYFLACLPGLVLQAYNNRKIFLYEWNRRHGKVQDGKPALASPYHILLTLVAIGMGSIIIFLFARDPLDRTLVRVQNAVKQENYARSLELCDRYYQRFGITEKHSAKAGFMEKRYRLSSYLRLSLLMEGQLNNRFLRYSDLHEMSLMYPSALPYVGPYDYSYIKVYDELGLAAPAVPQIRSNMELYGLQNRFIEPLVRAEIATAQYRLLQNTLYYARKTLYTRSFYLKIKDSVQVLAARGKDGSHPVGIEDSLLHAGGEFIDSWVRNEFEYRVFGGRLIGTGPGTGIETYPKNSLRPQVEPLSQETGLRSAENAALLDYYTLLTLLDKRLEMLPYLLKLYRQSGAEVLPLYVQEALCIRMGYPQQISRQDLLGAEYEGFRIGTEAAAAVWDTWSAYSALGQKKTDFEEVTRKYVSTYTYHYLFGTIR